MPARPASSRPRDLLVLAGVMSCVLGVAAFLLYDATAPRRALLRLAPAERAELYTRTRAEAESLCRRQEPAFEDECRRQLEFLLAFPECDADCQRFAAAHLHRPAR